MERRIGFVHGAVFGKSSALLDLINNAMDARRRVFVSFNFEAIVDGQHRLCAILDSLDDGEASAGEWLSAWSVGSGLSIAPELLSTFDPVDFPDDSDVGVLRGFVARLRSIVRSALRELNNSVRLLLSLSNQPDHPVTEFLIERRWFLLHG